MSLQVLNDSATNNKPVEVSKTSPCPHCGKPDWCYSIGELTVCNRDAEPASGWERTTKGDRNGKPYYALATPKKSPRPQGKKDYVYTDIAGNPLIKVTIIRPGKTKDKDVYQQYWNGTRWVKAKDFPAELKRSHQQQVTIYRYNEVQGAIAAGKKILMVEGEELADLLWENDIPATTTIGGAGKYRAYGSNYLDSLLNVKLVLCPDRDEPGLKHMEDIYKDFPDAEWLYAPPNDFFWTNLPKSGGLDIKDWIEDGASPDDINQAIQQKRIAKLESLIDPENNPLSKNWTQSSLAYELAENYREKLAWHLGNKCWYWYESQKRGIWSEVSHEAIGRLVTTEATARIGAVFNHDFVAGTIKFLKYHLAVEQWVEAQGLIPLVDGVLDPVTMKLLPHASGYRFLWQLPYKWSQRLMGYQAVTDWLREAMMGDDNLVQLLRAYLKAIVTGRSDLHRFLECIGPGGTGKSTFQRLAIALVGEENTTVTTLKQLEGNRFETASLYGKRLVLITDSERYGGEVSTLKAITGEDQVRNERKGIQQTKGFIYPGLVLVAANEPIQSNDYTSGLRRRRLTVPFLNQIPPHLRRDLEAEFEPCLAGVLEWVLAMPEADMVRLVVDTEQSVSAIAAFSKEFLLDTNPLADWLDNCCIRDPKAKTYVGIRDKSAEHYLYANYCRWMDGTGSKSLSLRRFSDCLVDLCKNQLGIKGISKSRDNQGAYINGIDIRHNSHQNEPRFVTGVGQSDGSVMDGDGLVTGRVTGQTRASDGCDGCDGLFFSEKDSKGEKDNNPLARVNYPTNEEVDKKPGVSENPSHPSLSSLATVSPVTAPVTVTDNSSLNPSLEAGDEVIDDGAEGATSGVMGENNLVEGDRPIEVSSDEVQEISSVSPTVADNCFLNLEIEKIDYNDYLSVETALKKAFRLGSGKEATVGKIYANACSNIQVLIADSTVIPDKLKQYILDCYQCVLNEMSQD
jgi:P4 family phage/plasmid primase-like protien